MRYQGSLLRMPGSFIGYAVALTLDQLDRLVLWQNCSEDWAFPVRDRPNAENGWKRGLPDAQRVDATALEFPRDPRMDVSITREGFVVVPRGSILGLLSHRMGFHGYTQVYEGDVYIVGQYRISDGWIAIYTAVNVLALTMAWFLPLPLVLHAITEKGAQYIDLFARPGELVAVILFITLVVLVTSLAAGSLIVFLRIKGFLNRLLNLPDRKRLTEFLEGLSI